MGVGVHHSNQTREFQIGGSLSIDSGKLSCQQFVRGSGVGVPVGGGLGILHCCTVFPQQFSPPVSTERSKLKSAVGIQDCALCVCGPYP